MDTLRRGIDGKFTVDEINQIIIAQERRNCEFLDSKIAFVNHQVVNLVTFKLFDDNTIPKPLAIRKSSDPPQANAHKFWEGIITAQNQLLEVIAYREK